MPFKVESSCDDLVAKLSLPKPLVLDHVRIAVPVREVHVEVLHLFGDLTLQSALVFLNADDALVSTPVALHVLQSLLEEERQILALAARQSKTLQVDM